MPCGCFGGSKKKGSATDAEGPPKPPKLPVEEPIKQQQQQIQQQQTPEYTIQAESQPLLENGTGPVAHSDENEAVNGSTVNDTPAVTTPQPEAQAVVDGGSNKSSGAKSRAELYAKRREFFRPLYDVSLAASNQRFATPRSSNTLPARGKRGAYLMGDGSGYFTTEGRYVEGHVGSSEVAVKYSGSGQHVSGEIIHGDGSSRMVNDAMHLDDEGRAIDRPPRPTSQPSALAGEWDEIVGQTDGKQQDEFHQKHQQIIQHQQLSGTVPLPPPPPKEVNPHFIEFQEKHHKILHDPGSHSQRKGHEVSHQVPEHRLTELDKLHNEVQQHYKQRMKNGPVDVESLVEKYTEDRWRKMVEIWESEGLVVEGGMVVVDTSGNVVEKQMKRSGDGGIVVEKVSRVVECDGEIVTERIEKGGEVVKVIDRHSEVVFDNDRGRMVKHTEEILVERVVEQEFNIMPSVTTIITPPTPQMDITTKTTPLSDITPEQMASIEHEMKQYDIEQPSSHEAVQYHSEVVSYESEPYHVEQPSNNETQQHYNEESHFESQQYYTEQPSRIETKQYNTEVTNYESEEYHVEQPYNNETEQHHKEESNFESEQYYPEQLIKNETEHHHNEVTTFEREQNHAEQPPSQGIEEYVVETVASAERKRVDIRVQVSTDDIDKPDGGKTESHDIDTTHTNERESHGIEELSKQDSEQYGVEKLSTHETEPYSKEELSKYDSEQYGVEELSTHETEPCSMEKLSKHNEEEYDIEEPLRLEKDSYSVEEPSKPNSEQYGTEEPSINHGEQYGVEQASRYGDIEEEYDCETLVELVGDENIKNMQKVIERERLTDEQPQDPSTYRVSPPPSPVPPQTCTPPPSPRREHQPVEGVDTISSKCTVSSSVEAVGGPDIVMSKSSATPPPSPPMQASEQKS